MLTPGPSRPTPTIQADDDWSKLRKAVDDLKGSLWIDMPQTYEECIKPIQEFVPKLLDAYAELWELSQALLQSVEQWKAEQDKTGLVVATMEDIPPF